MEKRLLKDKTYRYREKFYDLNKRLIIGPWFKTKNEATAWKRRVLSQKDKAKILGETSVIKDRLKFRDYAKKFLATKIKGLRSDSTYINYRSALDHHILPVVGDLFLDEIRPLHADIIVQELSRKGHNEGGTNKIIQILKTVIIGAEKDEVLSKNPLRFFSKLKLKQRPPQYLNKNEINQFLSRNIDHELYHLFVVALNTGMRRGELAALRWSNILFDLNQIEVANTRDRYGLKETTKTGRVRFVPMNQITKATLMAMFKKRRGDYLFEDEFGNPLDFHHIYRDTEKALKKAGIFKKIRFHDLRHSYASNFMMNGGNLNDLREILGHTKIEMTLIYAHVAQEHLAKASNIVSFGVLKDENMNSTFLAPQKKNSVEENLVLMI